MTAAKIAPELVDEMTGWRHDFHRRPELGFDEHRTSARVAELLREFGLEVHTGIGGTGVVGVLQRGNGSASIGFRADMDSMRLGAAAHLARHGDFNGRVIFIFQPNEEHGLGAAAMIRDGLFTRFAVERVFAMHNIPGMPAGSFATRSGAITASESLFEITITAQGGHAALPHMGVDAILVGAQLVTALQGIVSRNLDPARNGVVSVTEFITDGRRNVLAGRAVLKGDARALGDDTNAGIEAAMRRICAGMAATHGADISVSYDTVFPTLRNDHEAVGAAVGAAISVAGADRVNPACDPKLFSEDFAHMARAVPGCFMLIGNGTEAASARPLHASDYDFNDAILGPGAAYIATLAEQVLDRSVTG